MTARQKSFLFMSASILLSTVAQLSMKAGMLLFAHQEWGGLGTLLVSPAFLWVLLGLACYGLSLLFWMSAIAHLELSLAYPMLSLSYVLIYLVAVNWPMLHEHASWVRTLGIVVVVIGVILIVGSNKPDREQGS